MAKLLLVRKLRPFFDTWTEGTDWAQIEVKALAGSLVLSDLKLRSAALEAKLGRPVEVRVGRIGRVRAQWSWTGLFNAPIEIDLEGLEIDLRLGTGTTNQFLTETITEESKPQRRRGSLRRALAFCACRRKHARRPEAGIPANATSSLSSTASYKQPEVSGGLARRVAQQALNRLNVRVVSTLVRFQVAETLVCQLSCDSLSGRGTASDGADPHRTEIEVRELQAFVDPLPTSGEPGARGCVVEPLSMNARAHRHSGRPLVDVLGLELSAELSSLRLRWSHEQQLAAMRALADLGIHASAMGKAAVVSSESIRLPHWWPRTTDSDSIEIDVTPTNGNSGADLLRTLSPSDLQVIQEVQLPPAENAAFEVRCSLEYGEFCFSRSVGIDGELLLEAQLSGSAATLGLSSAGCRTGSVTLQRVTVLDGRGNDHHLPLLVAPRHGSQSGLLALTVRFEQEASALPVLKAEIGALDFSILPRWVECVELAIQAGTYMRELAEARSATKMTSDTPSCVLLITALQPRTLLPGREPNGTCMLPATLHFKAESFRLTSKGDGPILKNFLAEWSMFEAHFAAEGTDKLERVGGGDGAEVSVAGGTVGKVSLQPLQVRLTLPHLRELQAVSQVARSVVSQISFPSVDVPHAMTLDIQPSSATLVDTLGVASNLTVSLQGALTGSATPGAGGVLRLSGLRIQALNTSTGSQDLLQECDVDVSFGDVVEVTFSDITLRSTVHTLHALQLLVIPLGSLTATDTIWFLNNAVPPALSKDKGRQNRVPGRAVASSIKATIGDPDGLCGNLTFDILVESLDVCSLPLRVSAASAELGVREENGTLGLLRMVQAELRHSRAATATKGNHVSLAVEDVRILDSEGSTQAAVAGRGVEGSLTIDKQPELLVVTDGLLELDTVTLETSEAFLGKCSEVLRHCQAAKGVFLRSRCALLGRRPFGLSMLGVACMVESATDEAARAGVLPGSVLLSIGSETISKDAEVPQLLQSAELPALLHFLLPQATRRQELLLDVTIRPFAIRIDGFRSRPGKLGIDLQVQKATVQMPEFAVRAWRGTSDILIRDLKRAYATRLASRAPRLMAALSLDTQAISDSFQKALDASLRASQTAHNDWRTGVKMTVRDAHMVLGAIAGRQEARQQLKDHVSDASRDLGQLLQSAMRTLGQAGGPRVA